MSLELATALVAIRADQSQLSGDFERAKGEIGGAAQALQDKISSIVTAGLAAAGIGGLIGTFQGMIGDAEEAIKSSIRLETVVRATGEAAGFTAKELKAFASDLEQQIAKDGEEIQDVMTKLATFTDITGQRFKELTEIAFDMADAGFGSATGNAIMLGKAFNDPIRGMQALRRTGVSFTEDEKNKVKELIKSNQLIKAQQLMIAAIRNQGLSGVSRGIAGTDAGKLEAQRIALGNLREEMGAKVIPIQSIFMAGQIQLYEAMSKVMNVVSGTVTILKLFDRETNGLVADIAKAAAVTAGLAAGFYALRLAVSKVSQAIATGMITTGWGAVLVGVGLAVLGIMELVKWLGSMKGVQEEASKYAERFQLVWVYFQTIFSNFVQSAKTGFMQLIELVSRAIGIDLAALPDTVEGVATAMMDSVSGFILDAVEWIVVLSEQWKTVWDNIGSITTLGVMLLLDAWNSYRDALPQIWGYALGKALELWLSWVNFLFEAFVSFMEQIEALFWKIPEILQAVLSSDFATVLGDIVKGAFLRVAKDVALFKKGFEGEFPELFKMSDKTSQQLDLVKSQLSGLVDAKRELEGKRTSLIGGKEEEKVKRRKKDSAAAAVPDFKDGFVGFADFGKKIQELLLKDKKDKHDEKMEGLAERGVKVQEEILKVTKEKQPETGGLVAGDGVDD